MFTVTADLPQEIDLTTPYDGVMRIYGDKPDSYTGLSVSSGDINGDGIGDVIIGAERADPNDRENAGEVFVVFGSSALKSRKVTDLAKSPEGFLRIQGRAAGSELGRAVAAGDMDGDGYDDLLIGAWHGGMDGRFDAGEAYIVFGSPDLYDAGVIDTAESQPNVIALFGDKPGKVLILTPKLAGSAGGEIITGDEFGVAVSTGDINNDGYCDAIIGAWNADPYDRENTGKTYVIFGSSDMRLRGNIDMRDSNPDVLTIAGVGYMLDYPDNSGFYTAAGDVNGDGFDDVIVGAKFADPQNKPNTGEVYIVFGSANIATEQEIDLADPQLSVVRIMGCDPHDYTGNRLGAGDINGDGFDDVLIDAYSAEAPGRQNPGRTYVVFGSAEMEYNGAIDLVTDQNVLTIYGENSEDHLGKPSAGDINGDGINDLVFQSDCADPGDRQQAGEAYILIGSSDLSSTKEIDLNGSTPDIIRISGDRAGSYMGFVSSTGDIDGDGYDDVILGAHGASPLSRNDAGMVYVIWGDMYSFVEEKNTLTVEAPENVAPGIQFQVDISTQNVQNLFGVSFVMKYSQGDYIDVVLAEAGDFLGNDIISYIDVDESAGEISFGISRKAGQEGISGSGIVAGVTLICDSSIPEGSVVEFSLKEIAANDAEGSPLSLTGIGSETVIRSGITVWPGDTNNDGIVNQADILPIGLYWGITGPVRENATTSWEGQICQHWTPVLAACADANGSGEVNQADVLAIGLNWKKTHSISDNPVQKSENTAGIIRPIPLAETPISTGEEFRVEIQVEDVKSLFGISFILDYDNKELIEPLSVECRSFLGDDIVFLPQVDKSTDRVAVGICRKAGQTDVNGRGAIVDVQFRTLETIEKGTTITFSLTDVAVIDHSGESIGLESLDGYIGIKTGILENSNLPIGCTLQQNYPNPFNPSTSIEYTIPAGNSAHVRLDVYDLRGGLIRTLIDKVCNPGIHSAVWDATDETGNRVSSGIYMYRLQAGRITKTRKMLLLR